jgi:hypothetical protein
MKIQRTLKLGIASATVKVDFQGQSIELTLPILGEATSQNEMIAETANAVVQFGNALLNSAVAPAAYVAPPGKKSE